MTAADTILLHEIEKYNKKHWHTNSKYVKYYQRIWFQYQWKRGFVNNMKKILSAVLSAAMLFSGAAIIMTDRKSVV